MGFKISSMHGKVEKEKLIDCIGGKFVKNFGQKVDSEYFEPATSGQPRHH